MERVSLSDLERTEATDGVHLALMAGSESMNVQHFEIEPGAVVDEHSHPHEQTGFIYEGQLVFLTDGDEIACAAGTPMRSRADKPTRSRTAATKPSAASTSSARPESPSWQE